MSGRCFYCGAGGKMTRDHYIPRSKGGSDRPDNIVPACFRCNHEKGDAHPYVFIVQVLPFLQHYGHRPYQGDAAITRIGQWLLKNPGWRFIPEIHEGLCFELKTQPLMIPPRAYLIRTLKRMTGRGLVARATAHSGERIYAHPTLGAGAVCLGAIDDCAFACEAA